MIRITFDPWCDRAQAEQLSNVAGALQIPVKLIEVRPTRTCVSLENLEAAAALLAQEIQRQRVSAR